MSGGIIDRRIALAAAALNAVAFAVLAAAWFAAAGHVRLANQLPALSWAGAAAALAASADVVLVVGARHAVRQRARAVSAWAPAVVDLGDGPGAPAAPAAADGALVVVAAGGQLAHLRDCPLVAGKATVAARTEARCAVCQP